MNIHKIESLLRAGWLTQSESCSVVSNSLWLQARILEWVAIPFSRGSSQPRDRTKVSCTAGGFFTSWATREAQEYWSGEPIPSPEDLPNPRIELGCPALKADSLPTEPQGKSKNTGVGSLSLLQRIFSSQELNWGLLHCRWILNCTTNHWILPCRIQ